MRSLVVILNWRAPIEHNWQFKHAQLEIHVTTLTNVYHRKQFRGRHIFSFLFDLIKRYYTYVTTSITILNLIVSNLA